MLYRDHSRYGDDRSEDESGCCSRKELVPYRALLCRCRSFRDEPGHLPDLHNNKAFSVTWSVAMQIY